jgi:hypothetical protein
MPSVERVGEKVYREDDAGARWRVQDVVFAEHRARRVPLGDPCANHRFFVAEDGSRRALTLAKQSSALDAETLAGQLANAGYVGRETFDPAQHRAR